MIASSFRVFSSSERNRTKTISSDAVATFSADGGRWGFGGEMSEGGSTVAVAFKVTA